MNSEQNLRYFAIVNERVKILQPKNIELLAHVKCYVLWERDESYNDEKIFLPYHSGGIGFTLQGELLIKKDGAYKTAPAFGTRDVYTHSSFVRTRGYFQNISVRFTPGSAGLFCKNDLKEIIDENIMPLEDIFKKAELNILAERLYNTTDDTQKILLLDDFLSGSFSDNDTASIKAAINCIFQSMGTCRVSDISELLNTSERSILRLFNKFIGIGPNEYIKLVRFRAFMNQMDKIKANSLLSTSLDIGYYDQSHFIKEFKKYTSLTPTKFTTKITEGLMSDFYNV